MADHELVQVPVENVRDVLERGAAAMLDTALNDEGRVLFSDVARDLLTGDAVLWLVMRGDVARAALVTREVRYPRCWSLLVQLLAGEGLEDWVHLIADIERSARDRGCKYVEVQGRRGWERELKRAGYHFLRVTIAKEV